MKFLIRLPRKEEVRINAELYEIVNDDDKFGRVKGLYLRSKDGELIAHFKRYYYMRILSEE